MLSACSEEGAWSRPCVMPGQRPALWPWAGSPTSGWSRQSAQPEASAGRGRPTNGAPRAGASAGSDLPPARLRTNLSVWREGAIKGRRCVTSS
jgi:hypothetical protein